MPKHKKTYKQAQKSLTYKYNTLSYTKLSIYNIIPHIRLICQ
ncbi:protein of unknown function [Clostridium beijerinckii]|nr:protein of unknown function [Clostridium beijerinckii]